MTRSPGLAVVTIVSEASLALATAAPTLADVNNPLSLGGSYGGSVLELPNEQFQFALQADDNDVVYNPCGRHV